MQTTRNVWTQHGRTFFGGFLVALLFLLSGCTSTTHLACPALPEWPERLRPIDPIPHEHQEPDDILLDKVRMNYGICSINSMRLIESRTWYEDIRNSRKTEN